MSRPPAPPPGLEEIGELCLAFLAGDVAELERFMRLSGHSPASLRAALGTPGLTLGLLEHFVRNEPLLLAMCANSGVSAARVTALWERLEAQATRV